MYVWSDCPAVVILVKNHLGKKLYTFLAWIWKYINFLTTIYVCDKNLAILTKAYLDLCNSMLLWKSALLFQVAPVHQLYWDEWSFWVQPTDPHCPLLSLRLIDSSQKTDWGRGLSHGLRGKLVLWSGLRSLLPSMSLAHWLRQNCADSNGHAVGLLVSLSFWF